jgi:hypothetical protein
LKSKIIKFLNKYQTLKKFLKKIIFFFRIYFFNNLNFIFNILFGKPRNVEYIYPLPNYSILQLLYYWLLERPLAVRGIFIPRHNSKKKLIEEFRTHHNEHIIIDKIFKELQIKTNEIFFLDIGAAEGVGMSNTYLLAAGGARGISIEFNPSKFAMMAVTYRELPNVRLAKNVVTPENVCPLIKGLDAPDIIDILSLDIDSYDYYVLESLLNKYEFKILCLEINPIFPIEIDFTVKYPASEWLGGNFQGMSLSLVYKILSKFNYYIIHIDRAFVCAIKNNIFLNNFSLIPKEKANQILDNSINKTEQRKDLIKYREKSVEELLLLLEYDFKKYSDNEYLLKKSGLL